MFSVATNIVNNSINAFTSVTTETIQTCQSIVNNNQNLIVTASGGSTVDISNIDFSQTDSTNMACVASNQVSTDLDTNMAQTAAQVADAINKGLGVSGSAATNITNLTTTLGQAIQTNFNQTCQNIINNDQTATFTATGSSTILVGTLTYNQTVKSFVNCLQNSSAVTSAKTALSQAVTQSAKAANTGIYIDLGIIAGILVLGLIIIAIIKTKKKKK